MKNSKRREKIRKTARKVKKEIKEDVFNMPNFLTTSRLFFGFIVVWMLFSGFSRLSVAIVFSIGALTDALDGMIARKFNLKTKLGAKLDMFVDRIFALIVVLGLLIYFLNYDSKQILFLFLLISREIVGVSGVFIRFFRDKEAYKVKYIGKLTTFLQFFALAFLIADFSFAKYFVYLTFVIGIFSGFDYLRDSLK